MNQHQTTTPISDSTAAFDAATQRLVEGLVAEAIRTHRLRATVSADAVRRFAPGLGAQVVAGLTPGLPSVVVKAGRGPDVVDQARYLEQLAVDPGLPEFLRRAFPAVYSSWPDLAVMSGDGLCGYLMEDLSTHETLSGRLLSYGQPKQARAVAHRVWAFLERAYAATRSDGRPDFRQLYVEPARACLEAAAGLDSRLAGGHRLAIRRNGIEVQLPPWETVLDHAARALDDCASVTCTWAHGDLVAWNLLVSHDADPKKVRLIDPIPEIDDFAHDIGRLIMSMRFMHLADPYAVPRPELSVRGDLLTVTYDVPEQPRATHAAESTIIGRAVRFARSHGDQGIETRLKIATAAALLADLPQLGNPEEHRRRLARGAFAEALLELSVATGLVKPTA